MLSEATSYFKFFSLTHFGAITKDKMMPKFQRLIRFKDTQGRVLFGESPSSRELVGQEVSVYAGSDPWHLEATDEIAKIAQVCFLFPIETLAP